MPLSPSILSSFGSQAAPNARTQRKCNKIKEDENKKRKQQKINLTSGSLT
jgi:hypothetical protein